MHIPSEPPCVNCITLAICQAPPSAGTHVGTFITALCEKCCMLKSFLRLEDLGIEYPDVSKVPLKDRMYFNQPLSIRILALYEYMNWDDSDLEYYKLLAKGIYDEPRKKKKYKWKRVYGV